MLHTCLFCRNGVSTDRCVLIMDNGPDAYAHHECYPWAAGQSGPDHCKIKRGHPAYAEYWPNAPFPAPPSRPVSRQTDEQNLLVVCQDLHMSFTGSFVDWTHEEIERGVATIQARVMKWKPAMGRWAAFEGAVYALCCATLAEAEEWRRVFGRPVVKAVG